MRAQLRLQARRSWLILAVFIAGLLSMTPPGYAQEDPIAIGDTVEIVPTGQSINLRSGPGLQQAIVTTLEKGTRMTVVGGPQTADDIVWWELEGEPGRGWAAASFLRVVEDAPAQSAGAGVQTGVARGTVDAYGFSGWCFNGWRRPDLNDLTPIRVDAVDTFDDVSTVMDRLEKIGYNVRLHNNNTALEAFHRLSEDTIFFFYGHGANTGVVFHDDKCAYTQLSIAKPVTTPELQLVVLLGCETGQNLESPDNILRKFQSIGARKAIGMNRTVYEFVADHWNRLFWEYAVQEGMEAEDAARKAANDQWWGYYWDGAPIIVVVGDEDIYLNPQRDESNPQPSPQPGDGIPSDPGKWPEAIQRWLDDLRQSIERRIAAWLQELAEGIQKTIERVVREVIEEFLRQLCGAPASAVVLVGTAVWWRRRRSRR